MRFSRLLELYVIEPVFVRNETIEPWRFEIRWKSKRAKHFLSLSKSVWAKAHPRLKPSHNPTPSGVPEEKGGKGYNCQTLSRLWFYGGVIPFL